MIAAFFHLYLSSETEPPAPDGSAAPGPLSPGGFGAPRWSQQPAALTQAFPTPRAAVSYIMDTFLIVKRKDEKKWGDYRTQRVILEIYDALAESIRTGHPDQTRLDPPPADPRCCHPPR